VLAVFEAIQKQGLLQRVNTFAPVFFKQLEALAARCSIIREVRGRGFMIGIELSIDGRPVVAAAREQGLLINCTQEKVLRLLPAMTITKAQLDRALKILESALTNLD
jgi:acetylornithine/N-succinyldiaminopimelate aminotransferase